MPHAPALTRRALATAAVLMPLAGASQAAETVERDDLLSVFREKGLTGCFALVDAQSGRRTLVGAARARQRFVPASTFKIPNSLIAFETGVVRDADEVLPYGGGPVAVPAWAKDMSLREAMPISNVPIFQEVARRVGLPRYRDWLARLDYGNRDPGTVVDRFWLDGPLQISALEEAQFNARLGRMALPASPRAQALVHDITRIDNRDGATLHAKTGWYVQRGHTSIGWWSGWVRRESQVQAFTLNMDMPQIGMAPLRLEIGRNLLARLAILSL
ncbi:penicillin-binding transpeptidase domain-containing protein [Phreatobacter oligotrophus]|uniref:Beta-lactamase n=1 Tax=Phreatobacter oligotrophus TaxID=1122261 RepID=A0A2T4ZHF5_9HYPH|nr:penicillin-binding transpeptidase domain-containing protein [Phreatobacter oligotrophus]PTM61414.1 beta-lactamase class D [Phreatobacter oligotrophus]